MATANNKAKAAEELTYDSSTGTGSYLPFSGPLTQNPALIIFDNQSSVAVTISDDGTTNFKTFSAGQAFIFDNRANMSKAADDFTWPIGTQFYAKSSAGTGNFLISYVYAR